MFKTTTSPTVLTNLTTLGLMCLISIYTSFPLTSVNGPSVIPVIKCTHLHPIIKPIGNTVQYKCQ